MDERMPLKSDVDDHADEQGGSELQLLCGAADGAGDDEHAASSEDHSGAAKSAWCGGAGSCLCAAVALAAVAFLLWPRPPGWDLEEVTIERLDVPGLFIDGLAPAITTDCPPADPCGVGKAKGCSRCAGARDVNHGCLCSVDGPKPGEMMPADVSRCPLFDKCGLLHTSCATCPDSSWIREGCVCRQPVDIKHVLEGINDFFELFDVHEKFPFKLKLRSRVHVENYNFVGASCDHGEMTVGFMGYPFGRGTMDPVSIGPRSEDTVSSEVEVDGIDRDLGGMLLQSVLQNRGHLKLELRGRVEATVFPGMTVPVEVTCNVTTDVLHENQVVDKQCYYGAFGACNPLAKLSLCLT